MSNDQKQLITPPYTLKAIKKYNEIHAETISQQKKQKYDSMTPEQKEAYLADKRNKYHQKMAIMTPEQKAVLNANRRQYYMQNKSKETNTTTTILPAETNQSNKSNQS
jgi:hypothetical protein